MTTFHKDSSQQRRDHKLRLSRKAEALVRRHRADNDKDMSLNSTARTLAGRHSGMYSFGLPPMSSIPADLCARPINPERSNGHAVEMVAGAGPRRGQYLGLFDPSK